MKRKLLSYLTILLTAFGLASVPGCDEDAGDNLEDAGEEIEDAADDVGDELD